MNLESLSDEELEAAYQKRLAEKKEREQKNRSSYLSIKQNTVLTAINKALELEEKLAECHQSIMDNLLAFKELMNEYGDLPKNSKGGFSIENEEGDKKVRLKLRLLGDFDERADLAETHIRAFFEKTLKQTDLTTFEILMKLLERKKGRLEYSRVMQILSFEDRFIDKDWLDGCRLLKESYRNTGSKSYIEFEVKDEQGDWRTLNLNFSSL